MAKKDAAQASDSPSLALTEDMSVPFDIEEMADLKIGQDVVITIRGCINRLEGSPYFSAIGVKVKEKKLRKGGDTQEEGIRALSDDGSDY